MGYVWCYSVLGRPWQVQSLASRHSPPVLSRNTSPRLEDFCPRAHLFTWLLTWSTLQRMAGSLCSLCTLYSLRRVFVRRNSQSTWQRTLYPVVAVVNMAGWADHDTWWNVDFGSRASGAAWRYFEAGTPWGLTFPSSKTFFMSGSTQAGPLCQKP